MCRYPVTETSSCGLYKKFNYEKKYDAGQKTQEYIDDLNNFFLKKKLQNNCNCNYK